MALSLGSVILLLVSLLDVPGSLCRSSALCPHTSFYHDCWIRRFPGLFLNLPGSVQHGAQVLQSQGEPTAQLCSRKCCDHASCNLAVFYSENNEETNCHLIHCPQPESCILQPQEGAVLFTATAGIDPDLLVFDKVGQIDFNPRSSLKWERPNESGALASLPSLPHSLRPQYPPPNLPSPSPHKLIPQPFSPLHHSSPQHSLPHPASPGDSPLRSFPPTHSSLTAPYILESTSVSPAGARSLSEGANSEGSLPSLPPLDQPMSDLQSPAHLDSSKQHFNETKGHSGKNQSSDGEVVNTKGPWVGLWLLPGLLGSSMVLLCCCSGILLLGCCRRRKRGRYRPGRVVDSRRGTLIRFAVLKERV
ncbi:MANSC domain-containing protein 4 isoform 1-T2 [Rhinophrynus dorsalis]